MTSMATSWMTIIIDGWEQTSVSALDPNNILDAKGILAITERTTAAQTRISELRSVQSRRMKELETEAAELFVELEARKESALLRLGQRTGDEVTAEALEGRLLERLRELVDVAVEARFTPEG